MKSRIATDALQALEDALFELNVLRDGLNHAFRARERLDIRRGGQRRQRRLTQLRADPLTRDQTIDSCCDHPSCLLQLSSIDVDQRHVSPRQQGGLRNPGAHRPTAEHAQSLELGTCIRHRISSPSGIPSFGPDAGYPTVG